MKVVGKMCCEINPSCRFSLGDQCAFGDNVKECVLFFDEGTGGFFGATAAHGGFFRGWGVVCVEDEGDTML